MFVFRHPYSKSRRHFLAANSALVTSVTLGAQSGGLAAVKPVKSDLNEPRFLYFLALHTMESVRLPFWSSGDYMEQNLARIDHVLRDHRTQEVHAIDTSLLDYVHALVMSLDPEAPVHVISGYRSPATNAKLRKTSSSVARKSFHMFGRAIDIRIPGFTALQIRDAAIALQLGGVGYYAGPDFVHLDTGRFRYW